MIQKQEGDLNRHIYKEDREVASGDRKRCSHSLMIREMQIKSTVRYHRRPVRMAIIKETPNNKCWQGYGEKERLMHCWCKCKRSLVQVMEHPQKLKIKVPYNPVIPLLAIYPKEMKTLTQNGYMHPQVHCRIIYNNQNIEKKT